MNADEPSGPGPVAIIGMACLFPKADGLGAYWANICNGVDAITDVPPTHWRAEDYLDHDPKAPDRVYAARGGFLSPVAFPPLEFGITPNALEATDTTQLLGMMVARQCLEDAGYGAGRDFDRNRVSVILGVTGTLELVIPLGARLGHPIWRKALKEAGVADTVADEVVQRIADSYVGWHEDSFPGLLGNVAAGRIANRLDLGGTNCVVDAACASSLAALHLATLELQAGRADMVLSGGLDTFNDIFMYMCFSKTPALSPTGSAKPFDMKGDGTILGEGLGVLLLKRHADAVRDGDRIYAVIRGLGTSSDGKGNAIYAPSPTGQAKALRQAYRTAGISPASVELVEAHGTGTRAGDTAEATALTEVYRDSGRQESWCALGSVKSQIGHTKAAAGVAGLIKAALALHHKVLPPTIKVEQPLEIVGPGRSPFYVNTQLRPWLPSPEHPRRAAVSSFGFGGSNYHCVLEEAEPAKPEAVWDERVEIVAYSAPSRAELVKQLDRLSAEANWQAVQAEGVRSRASFSASEANRLVLVFEEGQPLAGPLTRARALLEDQSPRPGSRAEKAYFGSGAADSAAFLFPGQGSQYVAMGRDWVCRFPAALDALAEADAVLAEGRRLCDFLYPRSAFSEAERTHNEEALRATYVAQPALGAVTVGLLRVLEGFGVRPAAVAGHSYGELVALHAAGAFGAGTLHALSRLRGRLMDAAAGDDGAMLAVQAPLAEIEALLSDERLDLTIANRNAPRQFVLSGLKQEIERAERVCAARQVAARRLPVAAAFHSPLVAAVERPFREALQEVSFVPPRMPVFANTTARPYPENADEARDLLSGQLARAVAFVDEVENLYASGIRTFVEVGPANKLTSLVRSTLEGRPHAVLALDASAGKRSACYDLGCALAELAALGHAVDWSRWRPGPAIHQKRLDQKQTLTVPLCGANYVKPKPNGRAPSIAQRPADTPVKVLREEPPMRNGTNGEIDRQRSPEPKAPAPPVPTASTPIPSSAPLSQALRMTQDNLLALQRLGEQTADLHRQFLDGQDKVVQAFQAVLEQQQRLLQVSVGTGELPPPAPMPAPTFTPAPIAPPPEPAVRVAAPAPVAAEVPPVDFGGGAIKILLEVVSEKTGYPPEMLELDMELDADLGIDSIKRVEIFSVMQERLPNAPVVKPEHLGTLRTLRNVVEFLGAAPASETPKTIPSGTATADATPILLAVVSEKTGYPPEMLELDMEVDADLGIDSIKRVEIFSAMQDRLPTAPVVKPEHLGTLRTLRDIAAFLNANGSEPASPPSKVIETPVPTVAAEPAPDLTLLARKVLTCETLSDRELRNRVSLPASGEIWVTEDGHGLAECVAGRLGLLGHAVRRVSVQDWRTLPRPTGLAGLVILAPVDADDEYLFDAFKLVQFAGIPLRKGVGEGKPVLATVSRLDGCFGLRSGDRASSGGLAGLTKTVSHEWPEVRCKAIDLAAEHGDVEAAALAVVDELAVDGPLEVGIEEQGRTGLVLRDREIGRGEPPPITRGDVVIITGGARGVTAEVAVALAKAVQPTLVLVGRSPSPGPEPAWLAGTVDEAEIKRAILTHATGPLAPKAVAEQCQQVLAQREVRANLERLAATGTKVVYRSADVRDANAVRRLLQEVRSELGPVRGLIHGAGVLADRRIEDKTDEQFRRVFQTKVTGLRALLAELSADELKLLVLFSSTTARFGRTGQVDYAMANEVLNKLAQAESRRRLACKVVSLNWGPWDGGMVTRALKKVFAKEGIGLIPLRTGAEYLVRELGELGGPVEVVVLAGTGEPADTAPALTLALERDVRVDDFPVLRSHVLDGKAVVPLALSLEWLAHAALHGNPGLAFHGCHDLRVLKGIRLAPEQSERVRLLAGKPTKQGNQYVVPAELRGLSSDGKAALFARAEIVLVDRLPEAGPARLPAASAGSPRPAADIYPELLFHGSLLQSIERIDACGPEGIVGMVATSPAPAEWIRQPLRNTWLADPLALDAAFQLMIVWTQDQRGVPALPTSVRHYRQFVRSFPRDGVRVVCKVSDCREHRACADVEFIDRAGAVVARLEGYESVLDASLRQAFGRNRLDGDLVAAAGPA